MSDGVIQGATEYLYGAHAVAWAAIALYVISLAGRFRKARRDDVKDDGR